MEHAQITDAFFGPFYEKIRTVTAPDVLEKFLKDGILENYRRVRCGETGGHVGPPWYHGLICEVITGISDLRGENPDPEMEKQLDQVIEEMISAQRKDGWLHPYDMLMRPGQEWGLFGGNARWQHETYVCGCLIEAGVHHYRATGKTRLLAAAVRCANYLAQRIGEAPKCNITCEHSLAEQALMSLEQLFEQEPELGESLGAMKGEYLRLALFFIHSKGHNENRHQFPPFLQEYAQDHRPAVEQREAVGHAVRATLFYSAIAEAARRTGDVALQGTALAIWKDITETKLHINGSVGAYREDERFGQQYELPNDAYLETCAGVGLLFFAEEMFRLTEDGTVWDAIESTVYNLLPAAVSADGVHYTYENPLISAGGRERWPWHECPCCPPMLLKAVGRLPSLLFSFTDEDVWVNFYMDATVERDGRRLSLRSIPHGKELTVVSDRPGYLRLRIPAWADCFQADGSGPVEKGYAVRPLKAGETHIAITWQCAPRRVEAHPWVEADHGRVAVMDGPVLYAAEWIGAAENPDPMLTEEAPERLADGTIAVHTIAGETVRLIPYREWNNHGAHPMRVWLRQRGLTWDARDLSGWEGKLYRTAQIK